MNPRKQYSSYMCVLQVVISFVVIEFPQGLLLLGCVIDPRIMEAIYEPLGELFDLLVLLYSAVYAIFGQEFIN